MSENPNLIKRPILMKGREVVLGFDESALSSLLVGRKR
jgi:arsenate reductase-like glutaredoxin family protein